MTHNLFRRKTLLYRSSFVRSIHRGNRRAHPDHGAGFADLARQRKSVAGYGPFLGRLAGCHGLDDHCPPDEEQIELEPTTPPARVVRFVRSGIFWR